jgi:hypothetical protein
MPWLPIKYRDFYDIPRAFTVEHGDTLYFFDCPFDPRADEFPDFYTVYRLPRQLTGQLDSMSWEDLASLGTVAGRVTTSLVKFDGSKRNYVDAEVFDHL